MTNSKRIVAMLLLLLVPAVLVWADQESYREIRANASPPSEQITGATSGDDTTLTTPIADRRQPCASNTTVCAQADLSGSAGDTVALTFVPYHVNSSGTVVLVPGVQTVTVTAGDYIDAAADNICPAAFFEIPSGCNFYEIRHATPSAGNVDITWQAYSVAPQ